jgi:hypothetical protein
MVTTSDMSVESINVDNVFVNYIEDVVGSDEIVLETSDAVDEAFRNAAQELHPDVSSGDTTDEFVTVKEERDKLRSILSSNPEKSIKINTERTLDDISLEESLLDGIERYGDETVSYEVISTNMGEMSYSAVLDDDNSELMAGIEIEALKDSEMEVEATYFTDGYGELETIQGFVNLDEYINGEPNQNKVLDAVELAFEDIGEWVTAYAEEDLKPKYE